MDTTVISPLIQSLQHMSAEVVSLVLFGVCTASMLILFRLFSAPGLYLFNIVAILAANIQVLRGTAFSFSAEPVALGTVVFATTYLASDILTEHYGKETAKRGVWYCFGASILMSVLMLVTIGYPSLDNVTTANPGLQQMINSEKAIDLLFTPSPRILFASLLAFILSQYFDIWLFQLLNKLTRGSLLWLRTFISSALSAILDTVIFSALTWIILSPTPVSLSTLYFTYILGTLITRIIVSFLGAPILYLSYVFRPRQMRTEYAK